MTSRDYDERLACTQLLGDICKCWGHSRLSVPPTSSKLWAHSCGRKYPPEMSTRCCWSSRFSQKNQTWRSWFKQKQQQRVSPSCCYWQQIHLQKQKQKGNSFCLTWSAKLICQLCCDLQSLPILLQHIPCNIMFMAPQARWSAGILAKNTWCWHFGWHLLQGCRGKDFHYPTLIWMLQSRWLSTLAASRENKDPACRCKKWALICESQGFSTQRCYIAQGSVF